MKDFTGKTVKGYTLKQCLGTGGFGAVYLAHQSHVDRDVAAKIILPQYANQPDFIRRFEQEAQLVARLEHLHIVPLYDYWRDSDGAYLIMRRMRGGSLREALKDAPFDLQSCALLVDQISTALAFAHQYRVIHRDIKPENILLDEDGNAYLSDFGIAKDLSFSDSGPSSLPDTIIGSLDYLSPEQARGEPVTIRTDIYSLGVIVYEMLTGKHAFENCSSVERLYKHINDPLPLMESLEDYVRDDVNQVIQKATQKDPARRYADVLEFAANLRSSFHLNRRDLPLQSLLTLREQEVLQCLMDGLSNQEIAEKLFIAVSTVKWYNTCIFNKLGVRSRVQAVVKARELKLIGQSDALLPFVISSQGEPANPYKGLHAFNTVDAEDFFGRDAFIEKLLSRLQEAHPQQHFLALVGPSGSGKSSLLKAGLIPALRNGALPGSGKWFVVDMIPGMHPIDKLEAALIRVAANQASQLREQLQRDERGLLRVADIVLPADNSELVIIVDQFEEVFTLVEDETARQHFLDLLRAAISDVRSRVRVIVSLRADYYDRPLHYPEFGELIRSRMETVLPLTAQGLERAVRGPAERVGVTFEQGLVEHIVSTMNYQAGALPLLQYALTELFDHRQGRVMTHAAYQEMGGAIGALANRADEIYTGLTLKGQALARQMFLRLVTLGEGAEDTRCRTAQSELLSLTDDRELMEEIIEHFAVYRLLLLDHDPHTREATVEVAHEAILREWDRLRGWLNESREDIRQERVLARAAQEWKLHNQDISYLLRGARLEQVETWYQTTDLVLTPLEQDYIDKSLQQRQQEQHAEIERQEREAHLERRSRDFLRGLMAVFAIAALLAVALSAFAFTERNRAENNANYARSIALASAAQSAALSNNPDQAIAYAVAAYTSGDNPNSFVESVLYETAFRPATRRIFTGQSTFFAILSPDGRKALAWGGQDSSLVYWDVETAQIDHQIPPLMAGTIINSALFAPDGEVAFVAIETPDFMPVGVIALDLATATEIRRLALPGEAYAVYPIELSPDGKILLTASATGSIDDGTFQSGPIFAWDTTSGSVIRQFADMPPDYDLGSIAFSPDAQRVLTSDWLDGSVILWDVTTGEPVRVVEDAVAVDRVDFTPQGFITFAVQPHDFTTIMALWDIETGTMLRKHVWQNPSNGTDLHPDGQSIALSFFGAPTTVFDLQTWEITHELHGHGNTVTTVNFTPDGRHLLSASYDGDLRLWNLEDESEIMRISGSSGAYLVGLTLSPEGSTALTQHFNGPVTLWDVETGTMIRQFGDTFNSYNGVAFSSDGHYIVSGSAAVLGRCPAAEGKLTLWKVATGEMIWQAETGGNATTGKAFINGDTQIATADWRCTNSITIWDVATGEKVTEWEGHQETSWGITASPDGTMLVSAAEDNTAIVWDSPTGEILQTLLHNDAVRDSAFSPDGHQLLTASDDGVLHLWDTSTWQETKQMSGHSHSIIFMQFSPDGRYIVSSGRDNNIFIWDVQTGEVVRHFQLAQVGPMGHVAAFSADSRSLFINDENNIIHQVDLMLEPGELIDWVQANRYVRDLNCTERSRYQVKPLCETEQ